MAVTNDDPNGNGWTTAVEIGTIPRITYPFQGIGDTTAIIYERDFVIASASWTPLALNTADATYSTAFLFEETEPQEIGAGIVQWTRRFGTVPSSFTSYTYEAYTFPAYYDSYDTNTNYRATLAQVVPVKNNHTFMKTSDPLTNFAVAAQSFQLLNSRKENISYVDGSTTPYTYTTYTAAVSGGSTYLTIKDATFRRTYGAGDIWEQVQYQTIAK